MPDEPGGGSVQPPPWTQSGGKMKKTEGLEQSKGPIGWSRIDTQYRPFKKKTTPVNLELHMFEERHRTAGMTPAERSWRKKWVMDQNLDDYEPLDIEYKQRNPIRMMYRLPWDVLERRVLTPTFGWFYGKKIRQLVPKLMMVYVGICGLWYLNKYERQTWDSIFGFNWTNFAGGMYRLRLRKPPEITEFEEIEQKYPELYAKAYGKSPYTYTKQDWYDLGFSSRQAYLDKDLKPPDRP